jgi:hypothetical protein
MKKLSFFKRRKFWYRFIVLTISVPLIFLFLVISIAYFKQDKLVQELIKTANSDFVGTVKIKGSHIAPFASFPYISIDLEDLEVYEGKKIQKNLRILKIKDTYVGFNLLDIISGKFNIKSIKLNEGEMRIIQHKDGSLNISNALASIKPVEKVKEDFHLDLKSIQLKNIDLSKLNEENNVLVDAYITLAKSKFKSNNEEMVVGLDSKFELTLIKDGDTTFIKHKHFEVDTELKIDEINKKLIIDPTEINLENASFGFAGNVSLNKDVDLDLKFSGKKPDFSLFIAMAPEELIPTLQTFDNKGTIYFETYVKGKSANGHKPKIDARFGCENGFFNNTISHKKLEKIGFRGTFTNGEKRDLSTMKFTLENFSAKPEAGIFSGNLSVKNFLSPDIDMKLISDFDLDFLAKFVNSRELEGLKGKVKLTMNFHDIIDFENPEKSIEKLNESYFTQLDVENLRFKASGFDVPIKRVDLKATLRGHKAKVEKFDVLVGNSDLHINGSISDLPAIIHHTAIPVSTDLVIKSKFLDIDELTKTKDKAGVDEQIQNLSLKLKFLSSAKAITESPNLPIGEFFIEDLYAKMKHYPHTLHDFHADLFIDNQNFKVVDFSGMIDKSDFHFSGQLNNYDLWFEEKLKGDTKIEFDLRSNHLAFDNLFSYGGENYVPEDYRHEIIKELKIHGKTDLHFKEDLKSVDLYLTQLDGKMKVHPLKFEQFNGRIHYENDFLSVQQLKGKIGHSNFNLSLDYNLDKGESLRKNSLSIKAPRLDFDELMNFNEREIKNQQAEKIDHDAVFSIYDLEFPNMNFHVDIDYLNYHKYLIQHFKADLHTQKNHMLYVDKLDFDAAGGHFKINGYFSGKDKKHIYFNPTIKVSKLDLDKFMVKFDNFGQDHLVSENLHGIFSGVISGKIHMHADLVPKMDDSDITIDMTVLNGRLENYAPIVAMAEYFQDKNVSKVFFDTLTNVFTLKKSVLDIPTMTINSSLGFMEITGKQKIDGNLDMDYIIEKLKLFF